MTRPAPGSATYAPPFVHFDSVANNVLLCACRKWACGSWRRCSSGSLARSTRSSLVSDPPPCLIDVQLTWAAVVLCACSGSGLADERRQRRELHAAHAGALHQHGQAQRRARLLRLPVALLLLPLCDTCPPLRLTHTAASAAGCTTRARCGRTTSARSCWASTTATLPFRAGSPPSTSPEPVPRRALPPRYVCLCLLVLVLVC